MLSRRHKLDSFATRDHSAVRFRNLCRAPVHLSSVFVKSLLTMQRFLTNHRSTISSRMSSLYSNAGCGTGGGMSRVPGGAGAHSGMVFNVRNKL